MTEQKVLFSHIVLKDHRGQWRRITLRILFPPRSNLSINSHSLCSSDQFAICQKTDDQCFLVRIVRVSIMTLKSGGNTMIQGLNTNIAIFLPLIWLPSLVCFCLCFFIDDWEKRLLSLLLSSSSTSAILNFVFVCFFMCFRVSLTDESEESFSTSELSSSQGKKSVASSDMSCRWQR